MSASENAALTRKWFGGVWKPGGESTVHELLHPDGMSYMEGAVARGPAEFLDARAILLGAFPDFEVTVEATVAEGDHVVVRWSAKATHLGDHLGIAATSAPVAFRGTTWFQFREGRIVEGWDHWNQGLLLQELQTMRDLRDEGIEVADGRTLPMRLAARKRRA